MEPCPIESIETPAEMVDGQLVTTGPELIRSCVLDLDHDPPCRFE